MCNPPPIKAHAIWQNMKTKARPVIKAVYDDVVWFECGKRVCKKTLERGNLYVYFGYMDDRENER